MKNRTYKLLSNKFGLSILVFLLFTTSIIVTTGSFKLAGDEDGPVPTGDENGPVPTGDEDLDLNSIVIEMV